MDRSENLLKAATPTAPAQCQPSKSFIENISINYIHWDPIIKSDSNMFPAI